MTHVKELLTMSHTHLSHRGRLLALLIAMACAVGLMAYSMPQADAMTRKQQRQHAQALVAYEKLSVDVITEMANLHQDGIFFLMVDAEERDLQRAREILRSNGWRDLTAGDGTGEFSRLPVVEQTYYDLLWDGQTSSADGGRVGIALQQMTLGMVYQLLGSGIPSRDGARLRETKTFAFNNLVAYREHINRVG